MRVISKAICGCIAGKDDYITIIFVDDLYTKPQLYRYTPSFVGNQINQTKADLVFTKMNFEMNRFYISRHQEIQKQEQNAAARKEKLLKK